MLGRDTLPRIHDGKQRIVMMLLEGECNRAFRRRVFDRIVHENHDDLLDLLTVAMQGQRRLDDVV
ncbi:hypothetical protein D3C86_2199620 [compost metagenome]